MYQMKKIITRFRLAWLVLTRGGGKMLAIFFAMNIIQGWAEWSIVPEFMKDDVKRQLELAGKGDLAGE